MNTAPLYCDCGHTRLFHMGDEGQCCAVDAAGAAHAVKCHCKSFTVTTRVGVVSQEGEPR